MVEIISIYSTNISHLEYIWKKLKREGRLIGVTAFKKPFENVRYEFRVTEIRDDDVELLEWM